MGEANVEGLTEGRGRAKGGERPQAESSEVVEYRPHEDGYLQAEKRIYTKRDGSRSERGPYWYFRFHEGGRQKKIYLGRTDNPEGALEEKRPSRPGEGGDPASGGAAAARAARRIPGEQELPLQDPPSS